MHTFGFLASVAINSGARVAPQLYKIVVTHQAEKIWMYDPTTVQSYHGHCLIISPLPGHGEVANENPLILPRTLSIVGALVLLKRRAGKKKRAPLLGLPKSIY